MSNDESSDADDHRDGRNMRENGVFGGIYGMSFLGAAVYFIGHATSFWAGVIGFFKAVFWPAVIMYKVLELLNL